MMYITIDKLMINYLKLNLGKIKIFLIHISTSKFQKIHQIGFSTVFKKTSNKQQLRWYKMADFDPDLGDIKPIWDLSRMDWVVPLSQQSKKGDKEALKILNIWLNDWKLKNPPI